MPFFLWPLYLILFYHYYTICFQHLFIISFIHSHVLIPPSSAPLIITNIGSTIRLRSVIQQRRLTSAAIPSSAIRLWKPESPLFSRADFAAAAAASAASWKKASTASDFLMRPTSFPMSVRTKEEIEEEKKKKKKRKKKKKTRPRIQKSFITRSFGRSIFSSYYLFHFFYPNCLRSLTFNFLFLFLLS